MFKKSIIALALSLPFIYSCKKEGCTDSTALNYSETAKKDNGSCITEHDIKSISSQNIFVENFTLSFDNMTSMRLYSPNFNYQSGDMIIIETLNEYNEWITLPYIVDVDVHVEGSYSQDGTIWIYLKNDDGSGYYPPSNFNVAFRAGLIKKNGLILNPNLKDMSIGELMKE